MNPLPIAPYPDDALAVWSRYSLQRFSRLPQFTSPFPVAITPSTGVEILPGGGSGGKPRCYEVSTLESACVRVNLTCGFVKHPCPVHRCNGGLFDWRYNSLALCARAARRYKLSHCCHSWSDIVFLPVGAHEPFRRLALERDMRGVFHEVAVPTILKSLSEQRLAGWETALDCLGGCCKNIRWDRRTKSALCAHKLALHNPRTFRSPAACAAPRRRQDAEPFIKPSARPAAPSSRALAQDESTMYARTE